MLKKLLPVIVVLLILGAAVGGYFARPLVDFRFVDYPIIQDAALYGVEMYECVAERLADYPAHQNDIELVALEYGGTMTKIEDAELREIAHDDWRYALIDEVESMVPMVRVINLKTEDGVTTVQLYFSDGEEGVPFSSQEVVEGRLEITALVIRLMAEHCSDHVIDMQWIFVRPYRCLGRCVVGTVTVGIRAPTDVFLQWAEESEDLLEATRILEEGGAEVFMDSPYTPWIYAEEELPRPSTDPAPWDQEWFYEGARP